MALLDTDGDGVAYTHDTAGDDTGTDPASIDQRLTRTESNLVLHLATWIAETGHGQQHFSHTQCLTHCGVERQSPDDDLPPASASRDGDP